MNSTRTRGFIEAMKVGGPLWEPFLWFVTSARAVRFFATWALVSIGFLFGWRETEGLLAEDDEDDNGGGRGFRVDIFRPNPRRIALQESQGR